MGQNRIVCRQWHTTSFPKARSLIVNKTFFPLFLALMAVAPLAASAQEFSERPPRCSVTDMESFDAFIAMKPTPDEFRATYSCVLLVLPNGFMTFEGRFDNSRFVARLDQQGRIVSGDFR
jgi:hypothetical protein